MTTEIIDQANEVVEQFTNAAIEAVRSRAKVEILSRCRNCGEDTPGRNFCDVHCRDDFELREKLHGR